jgi:16S rRNA (cytosine967-C5)-methyltransferase
VRLARRHGAGAAGLVNAVLRRAAAAGRGGLPLPPAEEDPFARLAAEWSHPRWLVERWAHDIGTAELPALLAADNVRGPTALRANRLRTDRDGLARELGEAGVTVAPSRWSADGLVVERGAARLRRLPAWRAGRFAFQGEASQLIVPLLDLAPGARELDACAAPGGKATHAAAAVGAGGCVVALDARGKGGLARAAAEAARLGTTAVRPVVGDAGRPPLRGTFDAVLVDAPCSGLGTLRRHPEMRWRRRPEDVARLAVLQRALLDGVAPFVRPEGVLVYAVCTLTRDENEDVIAAFLDKHPHFRLEGAPPAPPELVTADGFLRTLPHRHGLDGFFAARLRRGARS